MTLWQRFYVEDIQAGAGDPLRGKGGDKRLLVNEGASGGIDKNRRWLHHPEPALPHKAAALRRKPKMQADHVGGCE